jgi:formylglycine-generating enzyme required for sulfatase activity
MSIRKWVVLGVVIVVFLLISFFHQQVASLINLFLNLPSNDLDTLEKRISILGNSLAITASILGGLWWLFGKSEPRPPEEIEDQTENWSSGSRDLAGIYYSQLASKCNELPLRTVIPDLGQHDHGLSLSKIYRDQRIYLLDRNEAERGRLAETRESLPLMQALSKVKGRRLLVRGGVGMGKSSFVSYLAHCIARSRDEAAPELPAAMVRRPVVRLLLREVGLRLQSHAREPAGGFLWDEIRTGVEKFVADGLAQRGLPPLREGEFQRFWEGERGFQRQFMNEGVLLLDGLDEVSETENRRELLRKAIREFSDHALKTFIIVTGRPYAVETTGQKLAGFEEGDLAGMTEAQIRDFILHWYLAAREPKGWDETQAETHARGLAEEIFARGLMSMAKTPMLLTLFIGLDYCDKRLPSSSAKLYEDAVDLLLQRWNENLRAFKGSLGEAERHGLEVLGRSREELLRALKKLAYATYQEQESRGGPSEDSALEFSRQDVLGYLCDGLPSGCDPKHLLFFLQFRSALLVAGSGDDEYRFPHRSFHEYLAASHILELPNWKEKVKDLLRGNLDWWREVFLLLVKKYSDGQYGDAVLFLHHVLLGGYPESGAAEADPYLQRWLLLAATAAVELGIRNRVEDDQVYRKFHGFLQAELIRLLNSAQLAITERAEAGRLLAELGDSRPGVTVKRKDGQAILRSRGQAKHAVPDIDWQEIPTGRLRMGADGEEGFDDEKPAHNVDLPRFFISRSPITNAQYRCFVEAGMYEDKAFWHGKLPEAAGRWLEGDLPGEKLLETIDEQYRESYRDWLNGDRNRRQPRFWQDRHWNPDNHPVVGVSWFEALAYSVWLNELLPEIAPFGEGSGLQIRLPTEAEWEYAARGVSANGEPGWCYAWGNKDDPGLGNYVETKLGRTSATGLFPPGKAFGLHDMSGNVWEWTLSRWGKNAGTPDFTYADWQEQEQTRNLVESVEFRVIRGGSWDDDSGVVRCAVRVRSSRQSVLRHRVSGSVGGSSPWFRFLTSVF